VLAVRYHQETGAAAHAEISMKTLLIVALLLYGIPLFRMRYQWRATVYRMTDWKINILPWFGHDTIALFTNRYFHTDEERRLARRFRCISRATPR
jgi:hypothetical protein